MNDFFQKKHSMVLVDEDLINFIIQVAKLETLQEFALRSTVLLAALKEESEADEERAPLINIEV